MQAESHRLEAAVKERMRAFEANNCKTPKISGVMESSSSSIANDQLLQQIGSLQAELCSLRSESHAYMQAESHRLEAAVKERMRALESGPGREQNCMETEAVTIPKENSQQLQQEVFLVKKERDELKNQLSLNAEIMAGLQKKIVDGENDVGMRTLI
jgi:hypothetical protein